MQTTQTRRELAAMLPDLAPLIEAQAFRVFAALIADADADARAAVTIPELCARLAVTDSTIRRALRDLRHAGHVRTEQTGRGLLVMLTPAPSAKNEADPLPDSTPGGERPIMHDLSNLTDRAYSHVRQRRPSGQESPNGSGESDLSDRSPPPDRPQTPAPIVHPSPIVAPRFCISSPLSEKTEDKQQQQQAALGEEDPNKAARLQALTLAGIGNPARARLANRIEITAADIGRIAADCKARGKGRGITIADLDALADSRAAAGQQAHKRAASTADQDKAAAQARAAKAAAALADSFARDREKADNRAAVDAMTDQQLADAMQELFYPLSGIVRKALAAGEPVRNVAQRPQVAANIVEIVRRKNTGGPRIVPDASALQTA